VILDFLSSEAWSSQLRSRRGRNFYYTWRSPLEKTRWTGLHGRGGSREDRL